MNALKSINARVKVLQKKHPKSKRTTLQKQAGREWKAGKLKTKRKSVGAVKKKAVKKKVVRRRKAVKRVARAVKTRVRTITKIVRVRSRRKAAPAKRKRVGSRRVGKSSILPMLLLGGLGLGAVYLLTRQQPVQQYQPTGNYNRDNAAGNIIAYATAASLGIAAISKLIAALNNSSDAQVQNAAANPQGYVNNFLSGD